MARSWTRWRTGMAGRAAAPRSRRCSSVPSSPTWATARAAPAWQVRACALKAAAVGWKGSGKGNAAYLKILQPSCQHNCQLSRDANQGLTRGCPAWMPAGLIKILLSFEHGVLPPNLHYTEPNPNSKGLLDGILKVLLSFHCCTVPSLYCSMLGASAGPESTQGLPPRLLPRLTGKWSEGLSPCCSRWLTRYGRYTAQVVTEPTPLAGGVAALSNFGFGGEALHASHLGCPVTSR